MWDAVEPPLYPAAQKSNAWIALKIGRKSDGLGWGWVEALCGSDLEGFPIFPHKRATRGPTPRFMGWGGVRMLPDSWEGHKGGYNVKHGGFAFWLRMWVPQCVAADHGMGDPMARVEGCGSVWRAWRSCCLRSFLRCVSTSNWQSCRWWNASTALCVGRMV